MDSRLVLRMARLRLASRPAKALGQLNFSSTRTASSPDSSHELPEKTDRSKTRRPDRRPSPSSPSPAGTMTTSKATEESATPESLLSHKPATFPSFQGTYQSNPTATMAQTMRQNHPITSHAAMANNASAATEQQEAVRLKNKMRNEEQARDRQMLQRTRLVEREAARQWQQGDIYAPHDLSPVEQLKARMARQTNSRSNRQPTNSRKMGGPDVLDELRLDPRLEYKNFSMIAELTSEMGRIKKRSETGLRAVNQRRMAKAVRRAIGIGLMPSVHKHPELMPERRAQKHEYGPRR